MELETVKCTLCLNKCLPAATRYTKRRNTKKVITRRQRRNITSRGDEHEPVKDQLQMIFLLRKILEIPQNQCCNLLQVYGDPSLWIDCCDPCSVLVEKARSIFDEIMILQNNFEKLQSEIKSIIIQTLTFEDHVVNEREWGVKETIRSFILQGVSGFENTIVPKEENIDNFPSSDLNASELNGFSVVNLNSCCVQSQRIDDVDSLLHQQNGLPFDDAYIEESDGEQDLLRLDDNARAVDVGDDNLDIKEEFNSYSEMNFSNDCKKDVVEEKYSYRRKFKAAKKSVRKRNVDKLLTCDVCKKCFRRRGHQMKHERIHTGDNKHKYKCSFCGKGYTYPTSLKEHERMHTGKKPYLCTVCGKGFANSSNLRNHDRQKNPYKCSTCKKCFVSPSALTVHSRIHTGEKPYKCSFCGKAFKQLGDLKKHETIHTGEKPFKCKICQKGFVARDKLKVHEGTHYLRKKN